MEPTEVIFQSTLAVIDTTRQNAVTVTNDRSSTTSTKAIGDAVTADADLGGANDENQSQGRNTKNISSDGFSEANRTTIFAGIALASIITCCCMLLFIYRKHKQSQRRALEEATFGAVYTPNNKFSTVQYIVEDEGEPTPKVTSSNLFDLAYSVNEQQRVHSSTIMEGNLSPNEESSEIDI